MTEVNRQCAHCDERELAHAADGGCLTHGCGCPGFSQSEYDHRPSGPHWTAQQLVGCDDCGGDGFIHQECAACHGAGKVAA